MWEWFFHMTLVSAYNKKYLFPHSLPFSSRFFLSSPSFRLSLFKTSLKPLWLKHRVICFFIWVPPFDKFGKNLILSRLWVYQLFKIRTPDSFLKLPRILSVCIQGNETGSLEKFGMEQCSLCPGSCWCCPSLAWALPGSTGNSGTALAPAGLMGTKPSARIFSHKNF